MTSLLQAQANSQKTGHDLKTPNFSSESTTKEIGKTNLLFGCYEDKPTEISISCQIRDPH